MMNEIWGLDDDLFDTINISHNSVIITFRIQSSDSNPISVRLNTSFTKMQNPNKGSLNQMVSPVSRIVLGLWEMLSEHLMHG